MSSVAGGDEGGLEHVNFSNLFTILSSSNCAGAERGVGGVGVEYKAGGLMNSSSLYTTAAVGGTKKLGEAIEKG